MPVSARPRGRRGPENQLVESQLTGKRSVANRELYLILLDKIVVL